MTRRENTQRRRPPVRRSRPLVLVGCGAKCTEPQYFTALRDAFRSRAVDIAITHHAKAPIQVVEQVVPAAEQFAVELAISNPCFELWLLLHHQDQRGALPQCATVRKHLRKHVPGYDKTKLDFASFVDHVTTAVERARALDPSGAHLRRNPSTGVWRLVEKMTE